MAMTIWRRESNCRRNFKPKCWRVLHVGVGPTLMLAGSELPARFRLTPRAQLNTGRSAPLPVIRQMINGNRIRWN